MINKNTILLIVGTIVLIAVGYQLTHNNPLNKIGVPGKAVSEDFTSLTSKMLKQQDKLLPLTASKDQVLDYLAPLGALDPYADEKGTFQISPEGRSIGKVQNIQYGYFTARAGMRQVQADQYINAVLNVGDTFDYKKYWFEAKYFYVGFDNRFSRLQKVYVLGDWISGVQRINSVFSDDVDKWKYGRNDTPFYDFSQVTDTLSADGKKIIDQELNSYYVEPNDEAVVDDLLNQMQQMKLAVVYKCEGKTIFMLYGLANNSFGFIKNSTSKDDLYCGLLRGRYTVEKYEPLEGEGGWAYYVTN
jgi:hypothetical protein